MPNMAQAVSNHNSKLLRDSGSDEKPGCNCQGGPQNCPVGGSCQTPCVVYEATVTEVASGNKETYTGVTSRRFKDRLYEHRTDMNNSKNRTNTTLSAHVWSLKDRGLLEGRDFQVSWRLKDRGTSYNSTTKKCRICLKEKLHILYKPEGATLNRRSEIFGSCSHKMSNLLSKVKD